MLVLFKIFMQERNIETRKQEVYSDLSDSGHSDLACVKDHFVAWWEGSAM